MFETHVFYYSLRAHVSSIVVDNDLVDTYTDISYVFFFFRK